MWINLFLIAGVGPFGLMYWSISTENVANRHMNTTFAGEFEFLITYLTITI